jgi:heme exporter protein D
VAEFFNMGGHGGFIWSSWGIAFVVLAILIGTSLKSMRNRERELARMEAEAPRRRRRRTAEPDTGAADAADKPGAVQ